MDQWRGMSAGPNWAAGSGPGRSTRLAFDRGFSLAAIDGASAAGSDLVRVHAGAPRAGRGAASSGRGWAGACRRWTGAGQLEGTCSTARGIGTEAGTPG